MLRSNSSSLMTKRKKAANSIKRGFNNYEFIGKLLDLKCGTIPSFTGVISCGKEHHRSQFCGGHSKGIIIINLWDIFKIENDSVPSMVM